MRTRRQQHIAAISGRENVSPKKVLATDVPSKLAADSSLMSEEEDEVDDENDGEEGTHNVYVLDGVEYIDYQEYVSAKRRRNQQVLEKLGFKDNSNEFMPRKKPKLASQRGIRSKKSTDTLTVTSIRSRKSGRLSGEKTQLVSLDYYVNNWNKDNTVVYEDEGTEETTGVEEGSDKATPVKQRYFKDRVNDGTELSIKDAVMLNDPKWINDNSTQRASGFLHDLRSSYKGSTPTSHHVTPEKSAHEFEKGSGRRIISPASVSSDNDDWEAGVVDKVEKLSIDKDEWVAKVTPDRIYSVVTHPSESKLVCCAGDKQGYIGLWDVDGATSENNNGVNLFRIHGRPVCCLEWLNNDNMISSSYDGSVRRLCVETGTIEEIFATYDDSDTTYTEDLGYDLDQGYNYWTQSVKVDPRYLGSSNPCLFVSTSFGDIFHVDLRVADKQRITFHESVSEKKINSVSLHPNGTTLATGGLDGTVRLFDIRKFRDSRRGRKASVKPLCTQVAGLSISSTFFSPSGKSLLTTSFANRLDLTEDAHLHSGSGPIKPTHSIAHNNQTGRWLTTFQAAWHPQLDVFCCGSMNKPRCMEIFNSKGKLLRAITGDSLSSVMSRTCFHPSTTNLVMVGGNSSGRVVAIR